MPWVFSPMRILHPQVPTLLLCSRMSQAFQKHLPVLFAHVEPQRLVPSLIPGSLKCHGLLVLFLFQPEVP